MSERKISATAQGFVEEAVDQQGRGDGEPDAEGQKQQRRAVEHPHSGQHAIGPERHEIAMGEMREAQDAEDHRNADGTQRVHAAKCQ
jgi:hypothetical protein